jgi:hypothetical protein
MKIHKLLIGCSVLMTISLITGCSTKSTTNINDLIETTVVSEEELYKNAREVTGPLPDNSMASMNEPLYGNDTFNMSGQPELDMIGEVTAINDATLTIRIEEEINATPPEGPTEDSTLNGMTTTISEQILTVTGETFINIQYGKDTTAASFSDINVGDMVEFSYTFSETGEQILSTLTIKNNTSNETTHAK